MAQIDGRGAIGFGAVLAPVAGDGAGAALSSSQRKEIGKAGDVAIIYATGNFHLVAGDGSVTATTSSPGPFPAGVYAFVMPNGCTHVAMIQATGATASGGAYKG
jgi:hypothetical protein